MKIKMVILTGDFSEKGKEEGRRKRALREMKKQLRKERQEHSNLEKMILLLDKQQLDVYGCISR